MPKRLLIITYYWPPAGGSGVQRWLKFTKYLRDYGWEPVIYTAKNPEVSAIDNSLIKDIPEGITVLKRKVLEPYRIFRLFTQSKSNMGAGFTSLNKTERSWTKKISVWIRGNVFIPDARMFWIKPSVRFLRRYLEEHPVDLIVSTGPPHSTHLIALRLKHKLKIPWIADFRDPWTNIDFFFDLMPTKKTVRKHLKLEEQVITTANAVTVVTPQMQEEFSKYNTQNIHLLTNGFDEEDFPAGKANVDSTFTITHVGSLPPNRNSDSLWEAISLFASANKEFKETLTIQLVGSVDASVMDSISKYGLEKSCKNMGYVPHNKVVDIMCRSQVLLLLVNQSPNAKGILTGKVFEYLATKRPILALGPQGGDIDKLINSTKAGVFAEYNSTSDINTKVKELWDEYKLNFPSFQSNDISMYTRRSLTQSLAKIMDSLSRS